MIAPHDLAQMVVYAEMGLTILRVNVWLGIKELYVKLISTIAPANLVGRPECKICL